MRVSINVIIAIFASCLIMAVTAFAQTETDKGVSFYQASEFEKAVKVLEEATKINKEDNEAWLFLGASFLKLGKEAEALRAFRASKSLTKEQAKRFDKTFEKALDIKKKPFPPYTDRARNHSVSGTVIVAVEFRVRTEQSALCFRSTPSLTG